MNKPYIRQRKNITSKILPQKNAYISLQILKCNNEPFHRKENHGLGEQTCGCQGVGEGVGWIGNLGLIDADYCLWNG